MALRYLFTLALAISLFTASPVMAQERLPRFQEHYVRERETPSSIAHDFNIRTKDFLMLNNFPDDVKLKPGQKVLIRQLRDGENPPKESAYKPGSDETPAKKDVPSINEKPAPKPGEPVAPEKKEKAEPSDKTKASSAPAVDPSMLVGPNGAKYEATGGNFHVVQKGQTFYHIAIMYHLTVDQLKQLNNMTTTDIKVGQELRISRF